MTNKTYKKIAILLAVGAILAIGGYVAALYGSSGPDAAPNLAEYGLVGYWNMEEGKEQTVYDRSGNANNGTLGASTSVTKDDPVFTSGYSSSGPGGTGLKFDGVNDYVNAGNGASLNIAGAITIEAWIYGSTYPPGESILSRANYNVFGYDVYIHPTVNRNLCFRSHQSGAMQSQCSLNTVLTNNAWNHIAFIKNGSVGTWYVNGQNKTGTYVALTDMAGGSRNLYIGVYDGSSSFFNGSIDSVRIYNRALSADEIRLSYNQKKPALEWKFDEGSGTAVKDEGFNNYDGTLHE